MAPASPMPVPVRIVDSHTGGEPTRVVFSGGPDLGTGPLLGRLERFRREHDRFRSAIVNEPRGSDVIIGALLVPPHDPSCRFGVIFFNNIGTIWMCGHGMIGLVATLAFLGWVEPGDIRIDTAVGPVTATLHPDGSVTIANVPSYRHAKQVGLEVPGHGLVHGDIAWGGNWFFLVELFDRRIALDQVETLTAFAWQIRQALTAQGITGAEGGEIDHIELFAASPTADSRNFVLCPGKAYDRSPCGTGTSAKVACLAADGKLAEGATWKQESVIGSAFTATYRRLADGKVQPLVTGRAYVQAESTLVFQTGDPFAWGIRGE
ncbi:4-hydroxyproline 2-epimerase [Verrucomicrobiota bacterium]|nr:4-hydroxyproline 2-epimerase [Verrucomicrobiota bacterium]